MNKYEETMKKFLFDLEISNRFDGKIVIDLNKINNSLNCLENASNIIPFFCDANDRINNDEHHEFIFHNNSTPDNSYKINLNDKQAIMSAIFKNNYDFLYAFITFNKGKDSLYHFKFNFFDEADIAGLIELSEPNRFNITKSLAPDYLMEYFSSIERI